jgi:hypothetical protein
VGELGLRGSKNPRSWASGKQGLGSCVSGIQEIEAFTSGKREFWVLSISEARSTGVWSHPDAKNRGLYFRELWIKGV